MVNSFSDRIIEFNRSLSYDGDLPQGFFVINPFENNLEAIKAMEKFYKKYYDDNEQRKFIIGINPGRHGAAVTGIPFTDTKRLESVCGIKMENVHTHEVSSVFIYDMIKAYGGAELFYNKFYINSPFPLAIVRINKDGKMVNANYYDDKLLFEMCEPFLIKSLKDHIDLGVDNSEVYVLGTKNAEFIKKLNQKANLFEKIVTLEHPRFIQQYKSKEKDFYIQKYISFLKNGDVE